MNADDTNPCTRPVHAGPDAAAATVPARLAPLPLLAVLALVGCPTTKVPEMETCTPVASGDWAGATAFIEGTDDWGLGDIVGVHYAAGDLDGDGYPDLIVTEGTLNQRDDYPTSRLRYVMMNRAGASGGRTFADETESSGLLTARDGNPTGTSHNFYIEGDVDGDGDMDLFAARDYDAGTEDATGDCSEIYLNDGAAHFALAPQSDLCIAEGYPTTGAAFTDYDGDGILDLWVTGWYLAYGQSTEAAQAHLYRGNGDGTFTDVTDDTGLKLKAGTNTNYLDHDARRPSYGATACDVNGDALPDLISSSYGRAWNQLWRNDGGTFTETGEAAHFDADTNLDYSDNLMYACYCDTHSCDVAPSVDCGGAFPDNYWSPGYDDQPARLGGNGFTTVCADMDNDGDDDLLTAAIAHDWAGDSADRTQLLLNDGSGIFERIDNDTNGLARKRPKNASWNEGDLFAGFFDFDNDGWRDILVVQSDYEDTHLWTWHQTPSNGAATFEEVSDATGLNQEWPSGLAIADFDLDGDLDVVTGSSTARTGTPWTTHETHLYVNQQGGNYIRFTGLPIGARVEIEADGQYQVAEVNGGYGTSGIVSDTVAQFGLGDVCMVDTVTVTLPGGESHSFEGKAGNKAVKLDW